ncbi:MAG TPA: LysE family transporter [Actinomycetes bacterium]|jgi:threonine/homoserine/homoserine lactone efflux protein|nr:LysE family transporter [Actinomycetes bacterium]
MASVALSPVMAGLGLGIALAGAPGPVQAVLLSEAVSGGVPRGLRAFAGTKVAFGLLLVCLALGLSLAPPSGAALRVLKVAGGGLLLWLAADGFRSGPAIEGAAPGRRSLPPAARGALAVLLNSGAWLFLAVVASPLLASASQQGGRGRALLLALALVAGTSIGDGAVVLLGGLGVRRAGDRVARLVRRALAAVLACLGAWLIVNGLTS